MVWALVLALTGEDLAPSNTVEETLEANGWDEARLQDLRSARQLTSQPWPFPVPVETLRELGFARFDAQLTAVRSQLGLDGLASAKPAKRPLDRDEQRLSADRPPHW